MRTSWNSSSPKRKAKRASRDFPVVCVGGSAGGLDAYIRLLRNLPADMGVAIVIVNHLRTVATLLHEILPQYTTMPVELITDRLVIEPNHVFIVPAQHDLHVLAGEFRLKPISKPRGWPDVITVFLRSLTATSRARWWRVQSRSALTVIAPFGSLCTRTVQGRQQTSQSCTSTDSPGSKSAGSISTPPGSPQNGHSTWKPDLSIQGRSAEKTPRAPQRMMPAIKTTRATFIRRVRPTGFPPLGPSPARTTPTTRSTVSPSQTKEFIVFPFSPD